MGNTSQGLISGRMRSAVVTAALVTASMLIAAPALAGEIDYGNFNGSNFVWLDVSESSATDDVPLFGAPQAVGDTLFFDDMTFSSFATNGSVDITDGQLTTTVMTTNPVAYITDLLFDEVGDYSLAGLAGEATASVGASFTISIIQVDNQDLPVPVTEQFQMSFNPGNGMYELSDEGPSNATPWQGSVMIDVAQMLLDASIAGNATKVSIVLDNSLSTASQAGTSAFIAKKNFGGTSITVIPTPGALVMLGVAGLVARRRRRSN